MLHYHNFPLNQYPAQFLFSVQIDSTNKEGPFEKTQMIFYSSIQKENLHFGPEVESL